MRDNYNENKHMRTAVEENMGQMKTAIEVMKKQIQILTDYKVEPKK